MLRPSSPDAVDEDLMAVWREAAQAGPIARAMMGNLIVYGDPAASREAGVLIDEVVRRHPSRVIMLKHDRAADRCQPLAASVGVVTFGYREARYGVEEIAVESACADVSLPSIVRRFLRGDVPTSLWWTSDFALLPPIPSLVSLARQVVYDSRQWYDVPLAIRAIRPMLVRENGPSLADVNWRRLDAMRRAIAHAIKEITATTMPPIAIRHRSGDAAIGWLLAGWLARVRSDPRELVVSVDETGESDPSLALTLGGITATMDREGVHVTSSHRRPFHLVVKQESQAEAVAAALSTLTRDEALHAALGWLTRRFSQS
jgi:glucose-6-phosphate dehydrogenase assembly protein OpcA